MVQVSAIYDVVIAGWFEVLNRYDTVVRICSVLDKWGRRGELPGLAICRRQARVLRVGRRRSGGAWSGFVGAMSRGVKPG